jgi:chaperonin GroES
VCAGLGFLSLFWRSKLTQHKKKTPLSLTQVIAVGPGKAGEDGKPANPPSLTVGSTVLYSKYAGTEFKNPRSDEEFVVVSASDVLATVA